MPSPNTNILKKYINQYNDIIQFYSSYAIRDIDEYISNCNDILALNDYNDTLVFKQKEIEIFKSELNLVLNTIVLINEAKYREMLECINEIQNQYSYQISSMKPYIEQWQSGC